MSIYHYHPDNLVYIRDPAGEYADTVENFALDYGSAAVLPVSPYNEIYYDETDVTEQMFMRNSTKPLADLIDGGDAAHAPIAAIIAARVALLAAQDLRRNPPLTLVKKKAQKILELKDEAVNRMTGRLAGITNFDQVQIMREQYLSIDAGSRTPTTDFQFIIDNWQAGKDAAVVINGLNEAAVDAYNVTTGPTWPV